MRRQSICHAPASDVTLAEGVFEWPLCSLPTPGLSNVFILRNRNSGLFSRPRHSGGLDTKFTGRLSDNDTLAACDIAANNGADGKISGENIYGHTVRAAFRRRKMWRKGGKREEKRKNTIVVHISFMRDLPSLFRSLSFTPCCSLSPSFSLSRLLLSSFCHALVPGFYTGDNIAAYFSREHLPLSIRCNFWNCT